MNVHSSQLITSFTSNSFTPNSFTSSEGKASPTSDSENFLPVVENTQEAVADFFLSDLAPCQYPSSEIKITNKWKPMLNPPRVTVGQAKRQGMQLTK